MNQQIRVVVTGILLMASGVHGQTPSIGRDQNFRVKLTSALDSKTNRKGDKITAIVVSPEAFKGATMEGQVNEASSSGSIKKTSRLNFSFSSLILSSGESIAVSSQVRSYTNSKGKQGVDEEGSLIESKNTAARAAVATGIGAAIGAAIGGAKGAAVGAGAGLIGGLVIASVGAKAPSISFAPGSELELSITDRRER